MKTIKEKAEMLRKLMVEAHGLEKSEPVLSGDFRERVLGQIREYAQSTQEIGEVDPPEKVWRALQDYGTAQEPVKLSSGFKVRVMEELRQAHCRSDWGLDSLMLGWKTAPYAAAFAAVMLFLGVRADLEHQMIATVIATDPELKIGLELTF